MDERDEDNNDQRSNDLNDMLSHLGTADNNDREVLRVPDLREMENEEEQRTTSRGSNLPSWFAQRAGQLLPTGIRPRAPRNNPTTAGIPTNNDGRILVDGEPFMTRGPPRPVPIVPVQPRGTKGPMDEFVRRVPRAPRANAAGKSVHHGTRSFNETQDWGADSRRPPPWMNVRMVNLCITEWFPPHETILGTWWRERLNQITRMANTMVRTTNGARYIQWIPHQTATGRWHIHWYIEGYFPYLANIWFARLGIPEQVEVEGQEGTYQWTWANELRPEDHNDNYRHLPHLSAEYDAALLLARYKYINYHKKSAIGRLYGGDAGFVDEPGEFTDRVNFNGGPNIHQGSDAPRDPNREEDSITAPVAHAAGIIPSDSEFTRNSKLFQDKNYNTGKICERALHRLEYETSVFNEMSIDELEQYPIDVARRLSITSMNESSRMTLSTLRSAVSSAQYSTASKKEFKENLDNYKSIAQDAYLGEHAGVRDLVQPDKSTHPVISQIPKQYHEALARYFKGGSIISQLEILRKRMAGDRKPKHDKGDCHVCIFYDEKIGRTGKTNQMWEEIRALLPSNCDNIRDYVYELNDSDGGFFEGYTSSQTILVMKDFCGEFTPRLLSNLKVIMEGKTEMCKQKGTKPIPVKCSWVFICTNIPPEQWTINGKPIENELNAILQRTAWLVQFFKNNNFPVGCVRRTVVNIPDPDVVCTTHMLVHQSPKTNSTLPSRIRNDAFDPVDNPIEKLLCVPRSTRENPDMGIEFEDNRVTHEEILEMARAEKRNRQDECMEKLKRINGRTESTDDLGSVDDERANSE